MKTKIVLKYIGFGILGTGFIIGVIFGVQALWNWLVPDPRVAGEWEGSYSKLFYGGDLQGVLDKLDYIQDLGVTAIYFNPLNDSPSLHKYDARNYTHIDRNFGPDPRGDAAIMEMEIHDRPSAWSCTRRWAPSFR